MNTKNLSSSVKSIGLASFSVLLMAFSFSSTVYAGQGKCEESKFTLVISVRHDATPTRLDEWKDAFQQASELLFDATDGQHQFGTILVCNKAYGGRNADIHLFEQDGRSYVNLPLPGLGRPGKHMFLYGDEREKPFVIVHEFGHYGYGVYDEYTGPDGAAECVEVPSNATASIMEGGWWQAPGVDGGDGYVREISEFCTASNHDPDHDTEQEHRRGESCWETMKDYYPDLTIPAGLPLEGPTYGADSIVWVELDPETRLVLCIDRSGSMNDPLWKMVYAKLAAKLFVDLVETGDKIGVVSYASEASVDFPLTEVVSDATKEAAKAAIEDLSASGATAMGAGLFKSLKQIVSPGDTACQQAIVLLSNGFQNTGTHPYDIIPDIKRELTRVFTIGVGDSIDEVLLRNIATQTNGDYFRVRCPGDVLAAFGILSMEIKDGGLVLNEQSLIAQDERIGTKVPIENTDEGAVFEITWEGSDLDLTLERPDGSVVDPGVADLDPDIEYVSTPNYEFYRIASPEEGEWTMVTEGVDISGQTPFTAQVLSKNKTIFFDVTTDKDQYQYPEEVLVQAEVLYGIPLTGVEVYGNVIRPAGDSVPIVLFDDGLSIHGDEFIDDGLYSNLFSNYNGDGSYSFELFAENTGDGKVVDGGEPLRPDSLGGPQVDPLPIPGIFKRWASTTVLVSGVPINYDLSISPTDINFKHPRFSGLKSVDILAIIRCDALSNPVDSTRVRLYDGAPDLGGIQIGGDQWAYELAPGSPDTVQVRWFWPDTLRHNIYVRVDPDDEIFEYNEDNNEAHRAFKPIVRRRLPFSREFDGVPRVFSLAQNRPNPFVFGTDIAYVIPEPALVTLKIYDSAGRAINTLVAEENSPGFYVAHWDGKDEFGDPVVSGVYFYQLTAQTHVETVIYTSIKKMILLR